MLAGGECRQERHRGPGAAATIGQKQECLLVLAALLFLPSHYRDSGCDMHRDGRIA